jgi:hypothetical protein
MIEAIRGYEQEEYAASLSTLRRLGSVANRGVFETAEHQLAFDDFQTSLEEMLKTDPEFRQSLDVDSKRTFASLHGQVVSADGTPMVRVIERGMQSSFRAAQTDSRMWAQYARDQADLANAQKVDMLSAGESLVALSMDPKNELRSDPKFWRNKGYREGIAYVQWYSKQFDGSVVAGSLSVDLSDEASWRQLFARHGHVVPADITPNEWLQKSLLLQASPEVTEQFIKQLRGDYYKIRGVSAQRLSVSQYVGERAQLLRQQFEMYYPALATAIHSGQTNSTIKNFAQSLLAHAQNLEPGKRQQLVRLVNTTTFSEADGRLMDGALRYAVVEDLRRGLGNLIAGRSAEAPTYTHSAAVPDYLYYEMMNQRLANNVQAGATAGRSYGGCAGQFNAGAEASASELGKADSQSAYGGRGEEAASSESTNEVCEYLHDGCYCCGYNRDGTVRSKRLKVKARRDSRGVAHCQRTGCEAWLASNGEGDEGHIWRKAQELQKESTV